MARNGKSTLTKWSLGKLTLVGFVVVLAVAAVNTASASAALNVCIKNNTGTMRESAQCASNEHGVELATKDELAAKQAQITDLEARVDALESLLDGVSKNGDTLRLSGLNLQVVNGTGSTNNLNGLGNVIIGYNTENGDTRTGSHNLVIGDRHSYTSHSGVASGLDNTLTGAWAFTSGSENTTAGNFAFVGAGFRNTAGGTFAFVGGGTNNTASGQSSFVGGGGTNTASGSSSFVGGGGGNTASGSSSFVGGGGVNTASGSSSFVGAGSNDTASGFSAFVGGGVGNTAGGPDSFVGGGINQTAGPGVCSWLANLNVVPC